MYVIPQGYPLYAAYLEELGESREEVAALSDEEVRESIAGWRGSTGG